MPRKKDTRVRVSFTLDPALLSAMDRQLLRRRMRSRSELANQYIALGLLNDGEYPGRKTDPSEVEGGGRD